MNLPDIPRVHTALAEWLGCLLYICLCKRRLTGWRLAGAAALALALQCLCQLAAGTLPLVWWVGGMAANILLMAAFIHAAADGTWRDTAYCTARAFTLAELAAALEWQLYCFFTRSDAWLPQAIGLVVVYGVVYSIVGVAEKRHFSTRRRLAVTNGDMFSAVLTALAIFAVSNISFVWPNTPFSAVQQQEVFYIRTLVDLCGLILLYTQQEQRSLSEARHELDTIHSLLHRQYAQYRQSKESIDLINRKYHDLKHQIGIIRAEQDPQKRQAYLEEMESGIRMVEAQNKTGNGVLDTILTGKSMLCAKENITMTVVADGALLDFMSAMDLCTVFGNALDNAIEYTEKVHDPDKRLIRVAVFRQGDMALLRFENYYEEATDALTFADGLPQTTKKNRSYHGYGLKSIRFTAEKYGGSMTVNTRDQCFALCVLLPLPEKKKTD